jgi:hypothetical protein
MLSAIDRRKGIDGGGFEVGTFYGFVLKAGYIE